MNVDYGLFYHWLDEKISDLYNGCENIRGVPFGQVIKVIRFLAFVNDVIRVGVNIYEEKEPHELKLADVWTPVARPKKALDRYKKLIAEKDGIQGAAWLDKTGIEIFDDIVRQIHEGNIAELLELIDHHEMAKKDSFHAFAFTAVMEEKIVNLREVLSQVSSKIPVIPEHYIDGFEVEVLKSKVAERVRSI